MALEIFLVISRINDKTQRLSFIYNYKTTFLCYPLCIAGPYSWKQNTSKISVCSETIPRASTVF